MELAFVAPAADPVVINGVGRAKTVKLQVRLPVRTLSVSVSGVSRLASLSDGHIDDMHRAGLS